MIIEFTSKSDIIDVARVDTLITLTLKPYRFPVPSLVASHSTTHAYDRVAYVRHFNNQYRTGSVECRQIASTQVDYVREFVESVSIGGLFEIDPESWQGHDALYATCLMTGSTHTTPHEGYQLHTFSFDYEIK